MVSGMRIVQTSSAAVLLLAALALGGCAAPAASSGGVAEATPEATRTSSAATLDAEPATGDLITGDGYSYTVPEGWAVPEQEVSGFAPDTYVVDLQDADGFADNVNVIASPAGLLSADRVEEAGVSELEAAGATAIEVKDRVLVAESEAVHVTASIETAGTAYALEQYYVSDDDQTYIVTFSFSESLAAADRDAIAGSVLVTWAWS